MYQHFLKPFLFQFSPDSVHRLFTNAGEFFGKRALTRSFFSLLYNYHGETIEKTVDGIVYKTPIVLSAGFDYNARLTQILPSLGFGGVEIGSITARPCQGNLPPTLTRLPKSKSIMVYKGLKNDGVDVIIARLSKKKKIPGFVIGVSIARTNDTKAAGVEAGIEDYLLSFRKLNENKIGDYYVLNISCPNSFDGEIFSKPDFLEKLLAAIRNVPCKKPIYVKMPINLPWEDFQKLLQIIVSYEIQGVIIGNLNKNYGDLWFPSEAPQEFRGGLSGKPCVKLSNELLARTHKNFGNRLTLIGCGGIFSPEDAMEKFRSGAQLVELITGMIFNGPSLIKKICRIYAQQQIKNHEIISS